jgi:hypothetical protein
VTVELEAKMTRRNATHRVLVPMVMVLAVLGGATACGSAGQVVAASEPSGNPAAAPGAAGPGTAVPVHLPQPQTLVPPRSELPVLPPTEVLEADFRMATPSERIRVGSEPEGWTLNAFSLRPELRERWKAIHSVTPVFALEDGRLLGITISGFGGRLMDRRLLDDPTVDLEAMLRARLGEEAYQATLADRQRSYAEMAAEYNVAGR